jgi:hypothetical protein
VPEIEKVFQKKRSKIFMYILEKGITYPNLCVWGNANAVNGKSFDLNCRHTRSHSLHNGNATDPVAKTLRVKVRHIA